MNETKGTIWFKAYDEVGNPISVTVTEDTKLDVLFGKYTKAIGVLSNYGLQLKPEGVDDNEKLEEVNAWVLGENSKDEPCVYLYSSHETFKFKTATIWVESIDSMPFTVNVNANRWPGAAPEREMAQKKGFLNSVTPFQIVKEKYMNKDGKDVFKYARVFNATQQKPSRQPETRGQAENKNAWSRDTIDAIIKAGYSENDFSVRNTLVKSGLAPNFPTKWVLVWFKFYRAARDADKTSDEAVLIATGQYKTEVAKAKENR